MQLHQSVKVCDLVLSMVDPMAARTAMVRCVLLEQRIIPATTYQRESFEYRLRSSSNNNNNNNNSNNNSNSNNSKSKLESPTSGRSLLMVLAPKSACRSVCLIGME